MQEPEQHPPSEQKPRYLIKSSPLVAGGKARLLSAKKVDPKPAKPREVSALEAHGYTDQAHKGLKGEPECVGPAILDGYAESARFYDSIRHKVEVEAAQQSRRLLSAESRLRDAQRRAKDKHVKAMRLEFKAIEAMLDRARNGGQPDPPSAIRKLEKLEGQLDGLGEAA